MNPVVVGMLCAGVVGLVLGVVVYVGMGLISKAASVGGDVIPVAGLVVGVIVHPWGERRAEGLQRRLVPITRHFRPVCVALLWR